MPDEGLVVDALWDYQHPDESEVRFRTLLVDLEAGGNTELAAEVMTQIARTQGLQRQFDEAHATLDGVDGMITPDMSRARIRYLLERGRTLNSSGNPGAAAPLFQQALDLAQAEGEDFYAVDAVHMLAIVEPPEPALQWNLRAIAMAEASPSERANNWLGSLYNNTGWTYHEMGDYLEALRLFEAGLAWQSGHGRERETRIAAWTVARCLRSLGRYDEALDMQRRNLEAVVAAGDSDGFVQEELGECLLAVGRNDEARPHFAAAFAVLGQDPWLQAEEPHRLARLKSLGSS